MLSCKQCCKLEIAAAYIFINKNRHVKISNFDVY